MQIRDHSLMEHEAMHCSREIPLFRMNFLLRLHIYLQGNLGATDSSEMLVKLLFCQFEILASSENISFTITVMKISRPLHVNNS